MKKVVDKYQEFIYNNFCRQEKTDETKKRGVAQLG